MDDTLKGQVTRNAAEIYEEFFVPALFLEWAKRVSNSGAIAAGQRALDVACGTGVLAREVAKRVQPGGTVVGLDRNDGMLAVARRLSTHVEWRQGRAEALPFPDSDFDVVVSQFGLMFFDDRVKALTEMWRVLKPAGRLAVAVWDTLERTPGYDAMTALLKRLFGERIANELRAPYSLGSTGTLHDLFAEAAIPNADIQTLDGTARFPSIKAWVQTDVKGWTLSDLIDDQQYETLLRAAQAEMTPFVQPDGSVAFPSPAHIVSAAKA